MSDALSLRAAAYVFENLAGAVRDGADPVAREAVALGSLMGGLAFANASLGAVHGLAHPIGAILRLPHGFVCAVLLTPVLEFNAPARQERMNVLARELGVRSGAELPAAIRRLADEVGAPRGLREFGLSEKHFPEILEKRRSSSMSNNPRPATDEDLTRILRRVAAV